MIIHNSKKQKVPSIGTHTTASISDHDSSWVEVSANALYHNLSQYRSLIGPDTLLMPIIKSNAYGHGLKEIATLCNHHPSTDWLGVVSLSEALQLRTLGIQKPILVLSIIDADPEEALIYSIDLVAYDVNQLHRLNRIGHKSSKKVSIHIKIDSGLSRLGFTKDDIPKLIKALDTCPWLAIRGIFSHLADSETDPEYTNQQVATFDEICSFIQQHGYNIPLRHISCSAALTANRNTHGTLARLGIGLYGLLNSPENKTLTPHISTSFSLKCVMTWKTRIQQIKTIPARSCVGYGCSATTIRSTTIAILPIGYWDGYDRLLSNCGMVMINGQYAPVIGRICMNLTMIDITNLNNVHVGNEVILLGDYQHVHANNIALLTQTISYEVVTRINPCIPRIIHS